MESHEALVGTRVRVSASHKREYLRGMIGIVKESFGHPDYLALEVLLEDGRIDLFWHYEVERVDVA